MLGPDAKRLQQALEAIHRHLLDSSVSGLDDEIETLEDFLRMIREMDTPPTAEADHVQG